MNTIAKMQYNLLHDGRFLLQVTGHRSQVTGCRSQVAGHRSQVAGRIKIKKQSVILAILELPEIPKRFHEQKFHCANTYLSSDENIYLLHSNFVHSFVGATIF